MSSFVIGKEEYIKAAGIVAGIKDIHNDIWMYDYELGRNMTADDYYNKFVECYDMNAISVYEQYKPRHDDEILCTDSRDYKATFKAYRAKGKAYALRPDALKMAIMELRQFFSSAIYQTEKESYMFKMQMFFNSLLVQLMPYLYRVNRDDIQSWGSFDVSGIDATINDNIQVIGF